MEQLKQPLPGAQAQNVMAPAGRPLVDAASLAPGTFKDGAVLLLLCESGTESYYLPLIERHAYEGYHSAQVSLPGGKREPGESLSETAVRECVEEIAVPADIRLLGALTPLYIPVSGYLVHPFVAFCRQKDPLLTPNEREVKRILRLGVDQLSSGSLLENVGIEAGGRRFEAPCYRVEGQIVWGATAMILSEFRQVLWNASSIGKDEGDVGVR